MFQEFSKKVADQFSKMQKNGKLYRTDFDGQDLYELYLKSFRVGDNKAFRCPESSEHNCNHCNNYIRRYGNVVALVDNKIVTMYDIDLDESNEYYAVAKAMSEALKNSSIKGVFIETYNSLKELPYEKSSKNRERYVLGIESNVKRYTKEEAEKYTLEVDDIDKPGETKKIYIVKPNETRTFHHFYGSLDGALVDTTGDSIASIVGVFKSNYDVFSRTMREIPAETFQVVEELILQGSFLNGDTYLRGVKAFRKYAEEYAELHPDEKDNWCWNTSYLNPIAKFKNTQMGESISDLAEGKPLSVVHAQWWDREDPFKKHNKISAITPTQKKAAEKYVMENGLEQAFYRRAATFKDLAASEIYHVNNQTDEPVKVSMFDAVKTQTKSTRHKKSMFDKVEEVSIEKFMKDILPTCSKVQLFLEGRHKGNMCNLTTALHEGAPNIFKYNNPFCLTYDGGLAGKSLIAEAVEAAGGDINGVLNARLAWNTDKDNPNDRSDLDLWAVEPNGDSIGFSTAYRKDKGNRSPMSGQLDVDNTDPGSKLAVENITWTDLSKMKPGTYLIQVNQYRSQNSKGFEMEIATDDSETIFHYKKPLRTQEIVDVCRVVLDDKGNFTVKPILPVAATTASEIYGLDAGEFHDVSTICLGPNHWGSKPTGNKEYLFMVKGALSPNPIKSYHAADLTPELYKHRAVLQMLGMELAVESTKDQLCGVGFNATIRDEVVLKLSGNFNRVVKVKF